jgi:Rps23 Pro-64 3,4-dihydroxylase Tpa1-like proline 4-hydroxylase
VDSENHRGDTLKTLNELTIDSFLPLARMAETARSGRSLYTAANPFPHIVLDNFFDPSLMDGILSEFPAPGQIRWQRFDNAQEIKLASAAESAFGPITRLLLYHLNSITFLDFLSSVTGIDNLIPDPRFEGGGLHQIVRGGKLGIHADFNKHRDYGLDRRINLLLYLNKNWKEEYGGHLQLWNSDMTRCEAKISPLFNRVVVFSTTDFTFHGHPDPLQCPETVTRKSLALYYFSNGRPQEEITGDHSTLFRPRHVDEFKLTLNQRIKNIVRECIPPILLRPFR